MKVIKKRPEGIAVVAWLFIALAFVSFLIILIAQIDYGYGRDLQGYKDIVGEDLAPAWLFLDVFILLGLGIGLINGKNWARIFAVIYSIYWIIATIFTDLSSGDTEKITWSLFWIVIYIIIIIYLSLDNKVKKFFTKK